MSVLDQKPEMTLQHDNMVVLDGLPPIEYHHFKVIRDRFLLTQDDSVQTESYCTAHKLAEDVFKDLEDFLFKIDRERQARYAMYQVLQAEFGKVE